MPWDPWVTPVTEALGPKVSLARTSVMTAVSSLVETVLSKASTIGLTVTEIVEVAVPPRPSLIV